MIYTAIDTFYLSDEQLKDSPSRKDDIDEATETALRIYGCDLVQESGILLKLPQAVMATGQVLFHRFYCKKSFKKFNVKVVAASCVWLASKLEECPRKARQVLIVFHRMECRRENLPLEHLDTSSKKYGELKTNLIKTERHLLKETGFICHVEHPHKFISNYLATLETPQELSQEAWNLANDSLRTTLCVRFKSEVVACGVVYAAARKFHVPLPENPPWWKAFDAEKSGIDEVCRVLAHLYSFPKAQYIPVCEEAAPSLATSTPQSIPKDDLSVKARADDTRGTCDGGKDEAASVDRLETSKTVDKESKMASNGGAEPESQLASDINKSESGGERVMKERERERERNRKRGRDEPEREREKAKERSHRDSGRTEKLKHHPSSSSRDRSDYHSSSRERERRKHHSYA